MKLDARVKVLLLEDLFIGNTLNILLLNLKLL